jgi:hypothetical protein
VARIGGNGIDLPLCLIKRKCVKMRIFRPVTLLDAPAQGFGPITLALVGQDGQEANADRRKARGNHNPSDRAIPNPKGC